MVVIEDRPTPRSRGARAAGVAPGTLYRHFADRPALIHPVALDNLGNALVEVRSAVAEGPTARGALAPILRFSYEMRLGVQLAMSYPQVRTSMESDRNRTGPAGPCSTWSTASCTEHRPREACGRMSAPVTSQ